MLYTNKKDHQMNSEYEIPSNLELKSTDYLELSENKNNTHNSVKPKDKSSQKQGKFKNDSDPYYTANDE
jgi:plastocyanin